MPQPMALLLLAVIALAVSALVTPAVIRLCMRHRAVDVPSARKVHTHGIPRLGGVAIFAALSLGMTLAAFGALANLFDLTPDQAAVLPPLYLGLCGFFFIGFFDDLKPLPASLRFVAQLGVALVVVLLSGSTIRISSLFGSLLLPEWLSVLLTVLWIVGVVNTFNWIDGLDGLAAGIAGISALAFLVLGVLKPGLPNTALTVTLCALLLGAVIGVLFYNFHPARIFIGDGGAFSLGYILAVASVVGLFKQAAVITFILPVLILALPITDTVFAIVRRLLSGQPITQPDNRHLHHRLLALMTHAFRSRLPVEQRTALREELVVNPAHRDTVLAMYVVAALFAGIAVWVGLRL